MANTAEIGYQSVKRALQALHSKLGQADLEGIKRSELSYFDELERLVEQVRLACVATIFQDIKYAHEKKVWASLWQCHTLINTKYRKTEQKLRDSRQQVLLRKVEQAHSAHLHTAQYFYRGYIQRLSSRYELPVLQRLLRSMGAEPIAVNEAEDAQSAHLETEVRLSFYETLLHLGDLARYRNQVRTKRSSLDTARRYYSLAQDLVPSRGDAHHQMAVLYIKEENRDFEIIYHFYRALAVEHPHQNALDNLKQAVGKAVSQNQRGGYAALDPQRMFAQWFSRLHARFFLGEVFTGQDELEKEVLHRFEILLRSPANSDLLQQAVLVNISAYYVAVQKTRENWTLNGSRSSQFILRCNVRFITVLSKVVNSRVEKMTASSEATGQKDGKGQDEDVDRSLQTALRLLRIYLAWIYTNRDDLVKFQEHLEPYISDMHECLTECLSTSARILLEAEVRDSLPYLLPEDVEVLGLLALKDWDKYRCYDDGSRKPHYDDWTGLKQPQGADDLARLYDLVICGCHLAIDKSFPYIESRIQEGGREWSGIAYVKNYQPPVPEYRSPTQDTGKGVADLTDQLEQLPASLDQPSRPESNDFNVDAEVFSRVNDFLTPPEVTPTARGSTNVQSTSYGMNTSTANDVFDGAGASSPNAGAAFTRPIPSLPWAPTFSPTSSSAWDDGAFSSSKAHVRQASLENPFAAGAFDGGLRRASNNPWDVDQPPTGLDQQEAQPAAQYAGWNTQRDPYGTAAFSPTSGGDEAGPSGWQNAMAAYSSAANDASGLQQASASTSGLGGSALHGTEGYSFPGSMNFSAASTSSLPPVNSPRGLPQQKQQRQQQRHHHQVATSTAAPPAALLPLQQQQQQQQRHQEPRRFDPTGRPIPPGSREGLTAAGHANVSSQWYAATTAWGQAPSSADDPTHFRNRTRNSKAMQASRAYDKNALYSAYEDYDNNNKKKPAKPGPSR
ncbi:uncharacterized protein E0L32_009586 [Thyridium curvatum]|uniref:Nonsense-mediated mRNA decay factor n=1 Tax=Thyridium curvatum TaxID=1093900 RepID=A0A507ANW3_9PEZI|nr:uncharacterized protein E0L32_009586 [Thyridium curvatum]TPX09007.1 hypothetical protein E0L32_009586 [Thyridium curvatum]